MLKCLNEVWVAGIVPSSWRHGVIIPLLKTNNIKTDPASYIPMCLTSNVCKSMERMVSQRLYTGLWRNTSYLIFINLVVIKSSVC